MTGPALWYVSRGTGVVTLVLFTAVVMLGILTASGVRFGSLPRFVTQQIHRSISLLAVVFLAVHIASVLLDSYVHVSVVDALVPFVGDYHPFWLGLGALAFDLLLAIVVTSLLRTRIGLRTWRLVHWAAYLSWPAAVFHGLGIGTDATTGWFRVLTVACLAAVGLATALRPVHELPWLARTQRA